MTPGHTGDGKSARVELAGLELPSRQAMILVMGMGYQLTV
jgi:hypothetical protein